jgi:hypothetical protein
MARRAEPTLLRRRLSRVPHEVAVDAEAVKQVVAELPHMLHEVRRAQHRRRRRLALFGILGLTVVAGGAVAFSVARRSSVAEPSALPPSVDVAPKI